MSVARFAVTRRITILMAVLVLLILGVVSYSRVPIDLFPNMAFPAAVVVTSYDGAGPREVENLVTRPIEQAMGAVTRVKTISSVSREATSLVIVEFEWGTDMDFAALDMREKVDLVKGYLPSGVGAPLVFKFDPSMMPIMMVSMTAGGADVNLRKLATDVVKPRLERVDGVAQVAVAGGSDSQVLVSVDQAKLAANGISWTQVAGVLRGLNINLPSGRVTEKGLDYLVRSIGEVHSLKEIEDLIIGSKGGAGASRGSPAGLPAGISLPAGMAGYGPAGVAGAGAAANATQSALTANAVRLKDVATVRLVNAEEQSLSRLNGRRAVAITIQKTSMSNTVQVAGRVAKALDDIKKNMPAGTQAQVTMNQADFISRAIDLVKGNAWQGALLAVAVLYLFLWNVRSVLIIGLAIPISIITTFNLLYFNNLTLNLMTLSGLALGVGMLVDNSIVVLENIFRRMQEGEDPSVAAVNGAAQVGVAISASTLTTVVVFLPVVFVGGISGMLFKELAETVTFSLLTSLVVAITFVPMAASFLFRAGERVAASRRDSWLVGGYRTLLRGALRIGIVLVLVAFAALGGSYFLLSKLGGEFIPKMDNGEFTVSVKMPPGTTLAETDKAVTRVEQLAESLREKAYVVANTGSNGSSTSGRRGGFGGSADAGSVTVKLVPRKERKRSTNQIMESMRKTLQAEGVYGGARLTFEQSGSLLNMGGLQPVEVILSGEDLATLQKLSDRVVTEIAGVPGVTDVTSSLEAGRPEMRLEFNRDVAAANGLSPLLVGSMVKSEVQGETVARYKMGDGDDIDVVLQLRPEDRDQVSKLVKILIQSATTGRLVELGDVARLTQESGPTSIQREAGKRTVSITANLIGRDVSSAMSDVKARIDAMGLPAGYSVEYGGEAREMNEAFSGLYFALALSVVLVYMVMAAQFESLLYSFIIMFTIPLAAIGVLVALYMLKMPLSIPSVIGMVVLGGVVVNNAIVMVDFIVQLRKEGWRRRDAVIEGAGLRLRPILMTTVTTLLGLIPMAIATGEGSELAKPLAVTLIAGLSTSTFLTLFIIPIIYTWVDQLSETIGGRGRHSHGRRRQLSGTP